MKKAISTFFACLLTAALTITLSATPSHAAQKCTVAGNGASKTCLSMKNIEKTTKVIEEVVVRNPANSKASVTASCSFTTNFSTTGQITTQTGAKVSSSAEGSFLGFAKASISAELSLTIGLSFSQSASQATAIGATATLKPGHKLTCTRKIILVSAVLVEDYYNGTTHKTTQYKMTKAPVQKVVTDTAVTKI